MGEFIFIWGDDIFPQRVVNWNAIDMDMVQVLMAMTIAAAALFAKGTTHAAQYLEQSCVKETDRPLVMARQNCVKSVRSRRSTITFRVSIHRKNEL